MNFPLIFLEPSGIPALAISSARATSTFPKKIKKIKNQKMGGTK